VPQWRPRNAPVELSARSRHSYAVIASSYEGVTSASKDFVPGVIVDGSHPFLTPGKDTMGPPSIRRLLVVAAVAASGLGGARLAAAGSERVALLWNAPEGCPTTQAILDDVERTLGGAHRDIAPVAAAVNVLVPSPPDGRWRANLVIHSHGKRAERQFEAESCEALASATGLIVGLAAEGTDDAAPTRSDGQVAPAASRADDAIAAAPGQGPANPEPAWNGSGPHVLVGGILDSGTMPGSSAPGIEAGAGQSWTTSIWRMRLTAGASFFPEQNLPNTMTFGVPYGRYWMVSFSGRGCLTTVLSRFEIGPCLGGELAFMHSTGLGGPTVTDTQYWASVLGSAVAALTVVSRVVVFARTEVLFPTTQRSFHEVWQGGTISDVYKIPAHAFRGVAGVELRF